MAGEEEEVSSSSVGRTSKDDEGPSRNSGKAKEFVFHPVSASTPKINVEKFDGKINFSMWRYDVMDALCCMRLVHTLDYATRPSKCNEEEWTEMNRYACGFIHSCLVKELRYAVMEETVTLKM